MPLERILFQTRELVVSERAVRWSGREIALNGISGVRVEPQHPASAAGVQTGSLLFLGAAATVLLAVLSEAIDGKFLLLAVLLGAVGVCALQDALGWPDRSLHGVVLDLDGDEAPLLAFVTKSRGLAERAAQAIRVSLGGTTVRAGTTMADEPRADSFLAAPQASCRSRQAS